MQNRAEALHNVESTITELSSIFTQLSTMVSQQGELAIRYHLHLLHLAAGKSIFFFILTDIDRFFRFV